MVPGYKMSAPRMARAMRDALIEEVKQRPVLYDTRREDHRAAELRDRAWLDIAEKLQTNSEILKHEWKILRDSLRQAMRKSISGKRGHGPASKRWYFESKMAFLLPHMTKRTVYSGTTTGVADGDGGADESSSGGGGGGGTADERASAADDGLELFFASVCACARALPRARQAALKRRVLDALLQAERECDDAGDALPALD